MNRARCPRRSRAVSTALVAGIAATFSSCSSFDEKYYVGVFEGSDSGNQVSGPVQFYRFALKGRTRLSDTRFEAGWYDATAVNRLFGEISDRPKSMSAGTTGKGGSTGTTKPSEPIPLVSTRIVLKNSPATDGAASATTLQAFHVILSQRVRPLPLPLNRLQDVHSAHLRVELSRKKDGVVECNQLFIGGSLNVSSGAGSNAWKRRIDLADMEPAGKDPRLLVKGLSKLSLAGGVLDVVSVDAQFDDGKWTGKNTRAATHSAYHEWNWTGGVFEVHGGSMEYHGGELVTTGSVAEFRRKTEKDPSIDLQATTGWLLRLQNAEIKARGIRIEGKLGSDDAAKFDNEVIVNEKPPGLAALSLDEASRAILDAAVAKLKTDAKAPRSIDIPGASLAIYDDPTKKTGKHSFEIVSADDHDNVATLEVSSANADQVDVTSGIAELSTTVAVENARGATLVSTGAPPKPEEHIFLRFGPEGISLARPEDERFVVFMNSNPKALTDRVKAFVNSRQTQETLYALALGPQVAKRQADVEDTREAQRQADLLARRMEAAVTADDWATKDADQIRNLVTQWLAFLGDVR
ncbi:MAG: hypothetical protein HYR85_15685 [Planctomycetes bacterium]|nr:hypothetical protein [Planctomycetota bacterium]MBI3848127.1 hypothetical protein [Planctomycetota bacterium]